jgi:hypothetical protein
MEDDIGSVLPVPCATELHHDSGHRVFREGLVSITACYHASLCPALRSLVVSLLEPYISTQILLDRHFFFLFIYFTNERDCLRNFALVSHDDGLSTVETCSDFM